MREYEAPVRLLPVIFVVGTAYSMTAEDKIGQLNRAVNRIVGSLAKLNSESIDVRAVVRLISYNSFATVTDPLSGDGSEIVLEAEGSSDFGAGLDCLNRVLEDTDVCGSPYGVKPPVIIFLTDSYPSKPWRESAEKLQSNPLYRNAIKLAVAIGDKADISHFQQALDSENRAVVKVVDNSMLSKIFETLVTVAVRVASSPRMFAKADRQAYIIERSLQGDVSRATVISTKNEQ